MRGLTKGSIARGILPYATTILSISLAATLRVEHACSNDEGALAKPACALSDSRDNLQQGLHRSRRFCWIPSPAGRSAETGLQPKAMDSAFYPGGAETLKTANLETFRAMWTLGLLPAEYLPLAGIKALESGIDTESSRILAGLEKWDLNEKAPTLFTTILEDLPPLSMDQAAMVFARTISEAILSGAVEPYLGARAIWTAASKVNESHEFHRLDAFIYAASEYDEDPRSTEFFASEIEKAARRLVVSLDQA